MEQLFDDGTSWMMIAEYRGTPFSMWADADDNLQLRAEYFPGLAIPHDLLARFSALDCDGRKSIAIVVGAEGYEWTAPVEILPRATINVDPNCSIGRIGPIRLRSARQAPSIDLSRLVNRD